MDQSLLDKLKSIVEEPKQPESLTTAQVKIKKEQVNKASHDKLLFLVAEYIRKSEILRCEINKETDKKIMLEKALKCISLMTGDRPFYEINIRKLNI